MTTSIHIPIILGASRPERQSEKVSHFILKHLQNTPGVSTQLIDVRDFHIEYDSDENIPEFHEVILNSDALILVFPEYNHGFPGKLKTLLDTDEYNDLPVALASVSSGQFGGVRGMELLMPVLVHLGMLVTKHNMTFPHIESAFDENGNPTDPKTPGRIAKSIDHLIKLAHILKSNKNITHV